MNVEVKMPKKIDEFVSAVGPNGRRNLYSAAANAVRIVVRDHLRTEAVRRHFTARELGATPTGHLSKGARAITFSADAHHGEVVIPIPGITRAWKDIEISPKWSKALTLPVHPMAYGRRVYELILLGWSIWSPKRKDGALKDGLLMGRRDGEVVPLYVLKKRVVQKQDRSLLPSDRDMGTAAARAIVTEINRVTEKASA